MWTRRCGLALIVMALAILAAVPVSRWLRAADLLQRLGGPAGAPVAALEERELWIRGRAGPIRARLYQRAGGARGPGLVVAHGVHYRGIDERRLVPFARELARAGRVVLTPELSDLADYRITRQGVDVITDSVQWLAQSDLVSRARVGVLGFSFAGGLSLVAAEQPELDDRLEFVTSVGGHHDLSRVLGFLLSDSELTPRGPERRRAHEYGVVVLLYGELDHFVEAPDRETLRDALRLWLQEQREAALARASQRTTASGERLFVLLQQGRLVELAPELEQRVRQRAIELAALSPSGRLREVEAPVYLLHGSADNVIPPSETRWAELELGGAPHRALVSPLLEHVEVGGGAGLLERAALVDFMSRLL